MYNLIKSLTFQEALQIFVPSLGISIIIAELYYKLGSFTLECIAFLFTWYIIVNIINKLKSLITSKNG